MKYFQLTDTGFRKAVNLKEYDNDIASGRKQLEDFLRNKI